MRKSTLFVSAMLTVFLMATIFGAVSAYQQVVKKQNDAAKNTVPQAVNAEIVPLPAESIVAVPEVVTAEQATTAAINFLSDTNVYSVEVVDYQGAPAYLVTFSSGDLVYVSSTGIVIANTKIQPVVVAVAGGGNGNQDNNGGGSSGGGNETEHHEEHEEHEEHESEDDD